MLVPTRGRVCDGASMTASRDMWSDGQTHRPKPIEEANLSRLQQLTCLETSSALELNQLSSQYLKTDIHQSLELHLHHRLSRSPTSSSDNFTLFSAFTNPFFLPSIYSRLQRCGWGTSFYKETRQGWFF